MADYKRIFVRVTENWPAKVLSVVAAIFLFAFHRMNDIQERFFTVPLHLDISGNFLPSSVYPQNVRVILRGNNSIYNISENDIEAHLDLTKYSEPGVYRTQISILRKGNAAEMDILEITVDPAEISLDIDSRISKTVPLVPNFQGFLEQGYEIISYALEPKQVVIDGPEKLLLPVFEIKTDLIDLRGRNSDFSSNVRIINPSQLIRIRGDLTAEFRCFIKELIIIHNFNNLQINIRNLDDSFEAILYPPAASVRIQGEQSMLEGISASMLSIGINCGDIKESGLYELPLFVEEGMELKVDRIEPEFIKVEIHQKETKQTGIN
ncbi:MAG: CdaR family protein [Treponema sp.]|nr:CdaR family protein [Treponema sp.]